MLRILSFVLAASLFVNIAFFAKWRKFKNLPRFLGVSRAGGTTDFDSNHYGLKIVEPIAVTQLIGNLQAQWWNEAVRRQAVKNIVDKDFPEESPILIGSW